MNDNNTKKIPLIMIPLIIVAVCIGLLAYNDYSVRAAIESDENLVTTILKVGKADAMVIQNGGKTLVLDTGEDEDGEELMEFLQKNNIETVDALIITHYDQDHVGGADTLLGVMDVTTVYIPDYEGVITEYEDFMTALQDTDAELVKITEQTTFAFGNAEICIDPPLSYEIEDETEDYDNNFSLITTISYKDTKLLFMGDAEAEETEDWLQTAAQSDYDFIKMPHHGEYSSQIENLLKATSPEYAAICDSEKNPANDTVLALLEEYGVTCAETAKGNITVISNGTDISMVQ